MIMRYSWLLGLLLISGCITTSQTTKDIAKVVIDTTDTLQQRHLATLDAYVKTLENAKQDTSNLLTRIKNDQTQLQTLKEQLLTLRAQAMIGQAIKSYQAQAQKHIFSGLDDKIEAEFWPPISAQQKVYRDKADELGKQVKSHPCYNDTDTCQGVALSNFIGISKQYRDYSVNAEYIIHLGYQAESKIWQQAVETFSEQQELIEAKAYQFLSSQNNDLAISTSSLEQQLAQVMNNFDSTIELLKKEKTAITQNWTATKSALQTLQQEIDKPAIWQLVLSGVSGQTQSILASYSGTIKEGVGGLFGEKAGALVSGLYQDKVKELSDSAFSKLNSSVGAIIKNANTSLDKQVDAFNAKS